VVAQMEAEWHMMLAERALANADVQIAGAEYRRITGLEAGPLDRPATGFQLPSTAEAMEIAMNAHPAILATRRQAEIAALGIDIAIGGMRPTVTLFGEVGIGTDLAGLGNWQPAATIGGRITIPIFGGGQRVSATREARELELQARLATDRIVAEVLAHTVAAYAQLDAAVARLRAAEDLEDALANVLSAVEEEVAAGRGALAAVNEAQRDLFDARVGVVGAIRDRILAVFNVLRMIGRLSPAALGIAG
jgi:outer membrane protein